MIRYLIKNNVKLMFRNTWSIWMMLVGPIVVIAALSSAFSGLMNSYTSAEKFSVGYRMAENSIMSGYMDAIKEAGEESGITFYEYPEGEPEEIIAHNELAGFVDFTEDQYVLYKSADYETEGMMLEYFVGRIMRESVNTTLSRMNPAVEESKALPVTTLDFMPAVSANDYYGIVYIVYFSWCGMVCSTGVLSNEKKYGINRRFQVSGLSGLQRYLAKYIPVTLTVSAGMGLSTLICAFLFDIHWGNWLLSSLVMFCMILAGSAFGLMLYHITENLAMTIVALFTVVWFVGFFGGSFETYMFSSMPDILKQLSPIYHGNRALVELSCMGHSDYVVSSILYTLAIGLVCSGIAIMADGIRKRGKA